MPDRPSMASLIRRTSIDNDTNIDIETSSLEMSRSTVSNQITPGLKDKRTKTAGCSFLQLPRELRDEIYHYALVCARYADIETVYDRSILGYQIRPPWRIQHIPATPGICLVNKQLNVEANEVLYSKNEIHFDRPSITQRFLTVIGSTNRNHIRSISCTVKNKPLGHTEMPWLWATPLLRLETGNLRIVEIIGNVDDCVDMDRTLLNALIQLFAKDEDKSLLRHLILRGFPASYRKHFPETLRVTEPDFVPLVGRRRVW